MGVVFFLACLALALADTLLVATHGASVVVGMYPCRFVTIRWMPVDRGPCG